MNEMAICLKDIKRTPFEDYLSFKIHESRSFYLGEIDPGEAYELTLLINMFNEEDDKDDIPVEDRQPIRIYINSSGGYVASCFQIVDAITLSTTPVYTINIASAYSAAGIVLIAGHKRFAYPHATFLWHAGSMEIGGDVGKLKNFMKFQDQQDEKCNEFIASKTNIQLCELEAKLHEDWWMDVDEMKAKGIIDEITTRLI